MEKASKIPKLEKKSDLLSRVSSFLPQLQAANEQLTAQQQSILQVDVDLEAEDAESDSDDSSSSSSDSNSSENEEESNGEMEAQQTTIQLRFAVGKTDENPAISWLADEGETEEDKDEESESDNDDKEKSQKAPQVVIQSLLGERKSPPTKAKGPLITELD